MNKVNRGCSGEGQPGRKGPDYRGLCGVHGVNGFKLCVGSEEIKILRG